MRLASTLNPNSVTEENIPVAIFRYNGLRKFLRLAEDYEDMINLVLQAFKIDKGPVSLQTSSLDACKGENVDIDESAYPLMRSVLGDLYVLVEEEMLGPTDEHHDIAESALPTPTASNSEAPSSPRSHADTPARNETVHPHTAGSLPPTTEDDEEREVEQMDEFATVNENDQEHDVFESRPNEVDVQEEARGTWMVHTTVYTKTVSRGEGTPNHQKFRPIQRPSASTAADDHTPTLHVKKEKDATPNRSSKDLSKSNRASRRDLNTMTVSADPDTRFELSIHGPEPNQVAQFKTRGKHTVGKVLGAACKTFGINSNRARLCYILSVSDGDGDVDDCELECELEETMAQFAGVANPRLFIRLDPPVEGDDDLLNFN